MKPKDIFNLFKLAFKEFGDDRASTLGAALAYYAIFAIGPLLVIVIGIAGLVFGGAAASGQVADTLKGFLGPDGADTVASIIKSASSPGTGIIASLIGLLGLFFGAMAIFNQLKNALNLIWNVPKKEGGGIMTMIINNLLSFLMVLVSGLLLLLSLIANAVIASIGEFVRDTIPGGSLLLQLVNYLVSFGILTLMFAIIFRVLPDLKIPWKDVWLGAIVTSLLFVVGQVVLGIYFSFANVGSAFGAAGSLVVILVWIYYSAQILFFGAEVTQVYANNYGSHPSVHEVTRVDLSTVGASLRRRPSQRGPIETREEHLRRSPWFS
ncbi:MAG: YihY/virulence factor BrkB family protein [Chloroflexota bacterium]